MLFKNIKNNVFKLVTETFDVKDQTFSDPNGTYSVKKMIDYVKSKKKVDELPIEKLLHNLDPSEHETGHELPGHPDFIKRAESASLDYPIIVVQYKDGLWIADGVHRLYKANQLNHKTIKAYILDEDELIKFKLGLKETITLVPKEKNEIIDLIRSHYLGTYPASASARYGVIYKKPDGTTQLVGAILYGQSSKPEEHLDLIVPDEHGNFLVKEGEVLELLRLFLIPEVEDNPELKNLASFVIAQGNKKLKEDKPNTKIVITRADSGQINPRTGKAHTGSVYQATGAVYLGKSDNSMRLWDKTRNKWIYRKHELKNLGFETWRDAAKDARENPDSKLTFKLMHGKHMYIYVLAGFTEREKIISALKRKPQPYPKNPTS